MTIGALADLLLAVSVDMLNDVEILVVVTAVIDLAAVGTVLTLALPSPSKASIPFC